MRFSSYLSEYFREKTMGKAWFVVPVLGLLFSIIAFVVTWQWENEQHKKDFEYRTHVYSSVLSLSFDILSKQVSSLKHFVRNEMVLEKWDNVSFSEWSEISELYHDESSAVRDIAWIERYSDGFHVALVSPTHHVMITEGMEIQDFPILNLALNNLNDHDTFIVSDMNGERIVFMLSAVRDQKNDMLGVVVVSWSIAQNVENVLKRFVPSGLDIHFQDVTNDSALLLYHHRSRTRNNHVKSEAGRHFILKEEVNFMERVWLLTFQASPSFFNKHHIILAWGVLILSILMTVMLSLFFVGMRKRHQLVEQQVVHRTQELHHAQERYRRLSETIPDAVGVHRYGKWIYVNSAAVSLLGVNCKEDLLDRSVLDVVQADDHERAISRIVAENQDGVDFPLHEEHWLRVDGSDIYVELQATTVAWGKDTAMLVVARDISARKEAEHERQQMKEQVEHVQRLESLGVLAGGIAHDFNNLLGAIMGNISIAQMELEEDSSVAELLEHTEIAAQRAADLCNQMLAYSGKGKFVVKTLNLSDLIREMLELLRVSTGKHVKIQLELADALPTIDVDIAQMQQVIMNLMINAAEAIDESGGTISVRTSCSFVSREKLARSYLDEGLNEGHYVILEIQDTGSGMDEETQKRIFDPFFTTKFTGRGLGMSAILGIIRGHHAAIYIDSKLDAGTTFRIFFPSAGKNQDVSKPLDNGGGDGWKGKGLVMLVDDEDMIRQVGKQMLERMGFEVLLAHDGSHALELFRVHQDEIHLIIMDVMMPGIKGTDCVRKIYNIRADVRVIMSSGYSAQGVVSELGSDMLFLQKPYNYTALQQVVRKRCQH